MALKNMFGSIALDETLTDGSQITQIIGEDGLTRATSSNPVPVTGTFTGQALAVENAISATSYNLASAAYSASSSISNDYILDSIDFVFTTNQLKTVTVTRPNGSKLFQRTGTWLNLALEDIDEAFNASENFSIGITQTSGACSVTLVAKVYQGAAPLSGNPVLAAGTNHIGSMTVDSALPAGNNNIGDVDVLTLPSIPAGSNTIGSVGILDTRFNRRGVIGPTGHLKVSTTIRLVGNTFTGTTVDTNFWTPSVTGAGTVTQNVATAILATGTTANGSASLVSKNAARYVASNANYYRGVVRIGTVGVANNVMRWGAFDANDGCFFQLAASTFSIVTRRATVDTVVSSGSFNGSSTTYTADTVVHTYEILWTNTSVYFFIDETLIHTVNASTNTWTATPALKVGATNTNSGGSTTNVQLFVRVMSISRLGEEYSRPVFYHLSAGVSETKVAKYGPGTLHRIIVNDPDTNGTITIYDNTTASGDIIAVIDVSKITTINTLEYDVDFSTGLTIVSATTPGDFTFVYE